MRRFAIKIIIFFFLCFLMDVIYGRFAGYLYNNSKGGETGKVNYICNKLSEDILVFGSSRGVHHYDPFIFEDSLDLSCYNCAFDGCGIILMYGLYKEITRHYIPSVIIYDVTPDFDYLKNNDDNSKYLSILKFTFSNDSIREMFKKISYIDYLKMYSSLYRYNSRTISMWSDFRSNTPIKKGFLPRDLELKGEPSPQKYSSAEIDSEKTFYFESFIKDCSDKGTRLVFSISPAYKSSIDNIFDYVKQIALKYQIPIMNHYCDTVFTSRGEYFYDSVHLNRKGATEFSKLISEELKYYL